MPREQVVHKSAEAVESDGWKRVALGDVVELVRGVSWRKSEEATSGTPVVTIPFVRDGHVDFDVKYRLSKTVRSEKVLREGDILLVGSSGSVHNVGRTAIVGSPPEPTTFASFLVRAVPKDSNVERNFLRYLFQSPGVDFASVANRAADGKFNLQVGELRKYEVLLPSPTEQRRIAGVLRSIEEAKRKTDDVILALGRLRRSLLQNLVGGDSLTESNGTGVAEGVDLEAFEEVIADSLGGDWGSETAGQSTERTTVLRGTDFGKAAGGIVSGAPVRYVKHRSAERRRVKAGDLLVEISGGSKDQPTGRQLLVTQRLEALDPPVTFTNFVRRLRVDSSRIEPSYASLAWEWLYQQGSTRKYEKRTTNIRNFKVKEFLANESIPVPPLDEQRRIIRIVASVDRKLRCEEQRSAALEVLFKGSLEELCLGRRRVAVPEAVDG